MFRNNTNIIGFLQKKAFFNRSPSPSPSHNSRFTNQQNATLSPSSRFATSPNPNLTPPKAYNEQRMSTNTLPVNRSLFDSNKDYQKPEPANTTKRLEAPPASKTPTPSNKPPPKQAPKSRNFESSRVEVKMCLQQLSGKVAVQLRQLQGAITELTVSLQSIFYKKLGELKQEMLQNIEQVFAKAREDLNNLVTSTNQRHLKRLLRSKHALSESQKQVKELRTQLDSNWRQAAGEMFANNFDQRVEKVLEESQVARKGLQPRGQGGKGHEQPFWQSLRKSVQGLIERRCK